MGTSQIDVCASVFAMWPLSAEIKPLYLNCGTRNVPCISNHLTYRHPLCYSCNFLHFSTGCSEILFINSGTHNVNTDQKVLEQNTIVGILEKNRRFIVTTKRKAYFLVPFMSYHIYSVLKTLIILTLDSWDKKRVLEIHTGQALLYRFSRYVDRADPNSRAV
jgi:hypothetical protein